MLGWLTWVGAKTVLKHKAKRRRARHGRGLEAPEQGRDRGRPRRRRRRAVVLAPQELGRPAAGLRKLSPAVTLFRAALDGLVPYEPGKPEEEVQRELGLDRVVKLASNEGPWGPFPAALEAMERSARGAQPLSRRRRVPPPPRARRAPRRRSRRTSSPAPARTRVIGHLSRRDARSRATRSSPAWPSFISYVLDTLKLGAVPRKVPLRRRPLRPRRAARRDRAAHEARLHRDAEQPDRDDDDAGAARRLLRARPRARAHGARPGVLRVHRAAGLPGRRSRST